MFWLLFHPPVRYALRKLKSVPGESISAGLPTALKATLVNWGFVDTANSLPAFVRLPVMLRFEALVN